MTRRTKPDKQRRAVYAWERGWCDWNRETLTLPDARLYVQRACRKYGLKPPAVRQHNTGEMTHSVFPEYISFQTCHKNPAIALHESAHFICDFIFGDELEDHCPEWLGVYLALLEDFRVAPRAALLAALEGRGLKWWPYAAVSPQALRSKANTSSRGGKRSSR